MVQDCKAAQGNQLAICFCVVFPDTVSSSVLEHCVTRRKEVALSDSAVIVVVNFRSSKLQHEQRVKGARLHMKSAERRVRVHS